MKKLLTFYSDSHEILYAKYFLPTYERYLADDFVLIPKKVDQISPTGDFASFRFDEVMLQKIDFIASTIETSGEDFMFSDCDVQFFAPMQYELGEYDVLFQQDFYPGNVCAGFFVAKQNERTHRFFNQARDTLASRIGMRTDDQMIINEMLRESSPTVHASMLPKEKYWTVGNWTQGAVWNGEDFDCPETIVSHHANFTTNVANKIKLLDMVREKMHAYGKA